MTNFVFFLNIFENPEKNMGPRSAPRAPQSDQEEPKSTTRALRGAPGMAQESPRRLLREVLDALCPRFVFGREKMLKKAKVRIEKGEKPKSIG